MRAGLNFLNSPRASCSFQTGITGELIIFKQMIDQGAFDHVKIIAEGEVSVKI